MNDYEDLAQNYYDILPKYLNADILDLGCGRGRVIDWLFEKGYYNIVGLDQDPEALAVVKEKRPKLELICSSTLDPLVPYHFDFVIARDVIYLIKKDEVINYLSKLRSLLKPDGKVLIEVINGVALTANYTAQKEWNTEWIPNEWNMKHVLEKSGFSIETIRAIETPSRGWKRMCYKIVHRLWMGILKAIFITERGKALQNPTIFTLKFIAVASRNERYKKTPHPSHTPH